MAQGSGAECGAPHDRRELAMAPETLHAFVAAWGRRGEGREGGRHGNSSDQLSHSTGLSCAPDRCALSAIASAEGRGGSGLPQPLERTGTAQFSESQKMPTLAAAIAGLTGATCCYKARAREERRGGRKLRRA